MRWYPSKLDWWLAILLLIAPLICFAAVIGTWQMQEGVWIAAGNLAFLVAIYGGLVFPMRYGIDDEHLVVRYGLVRQRIRLADITEVTPTRNPLGAPALSLDRLAIKFGRKSTMISPAAKSEFLDELAARANLRREGDRLSR